MIQNLVIHIILPAGIKTTDGAALLEPVTVDFISQLTPYYASVEQVQLNGGVVIKNLSDITIASQIYMISRQADLLNKRPPINAYAINSYNPGSNLYQAFLYSRNQWVAAKAARQLISNVSMLYSPGSHVLANFSVARQRGYQNEGISGQLSYLDEEIKRHEIVIKSGGTLDTDGHVLPAMAAKGVLDWQERTPARTWFVTGQGANATSMDPGSPGGGRGKPVKFYSPNFYSPTLTNLRVGVYQLGYPLQIAYSYPMGV